MKLVKSSFYYRPKAKSPERMEAEADLRDKIEAIYLKYTRYGYRRVTHALKYRGCHVNHKKVLKTMRESDLLCRVWLSIRLNLKHGFLTYSIIAVTHSELQKRNIKTT